MASHDFFNQNDLGTFGKFTSDLEILAIRSSKISGERIKISQWMYCG